MSWSPLMIVVMVVKEVSGDLIQSVDNFAKFSYLVPVRLFIPKHNHATQVEANCVMSQSPHFATQHCPNDEKYLNKVLFTLHFKLVHFIY